MLFRTKAVLLEGACYRQLFGNGRLKADGRTFAGDVRLRSLNLRIEPRASGEVFTLGRTEANDQTTTAGMVLYVDGVARDFQEGECSGNAIVAANRQPRRSRSCAPAEQALGLDAPG